MKKLVIALVVLIVLSVVGLIVVGRTFFPDNVAETAIDGGKKGLKTRVYDSDVAAVRNVSLEVIGGLTTWGREWSLTDKTDGGAVSHLKVEVPVVFFTDDLEVTIKSPEEGKVHVDVRSQSRVGKSDFGENARHVRQFLEALDAKIKVK